MSSIAYVADEEMLEYHRLCRNQTMLFWRLTEKKKFKNFRKGDLLFFFSKPHRGRKKGLVGYAHYDSMKRLSADMMWKKYGETTGYATKERLFDALETASRGNIPEKMSCLYLTDVVFFLVPVYPDEIGLDIPQKLESYTYIDQNDSKFTVRILEKAAKHGIDLWSANPDISPDEIFQNDMIRQQIAAIDHEIGTISINAKEYAAARKLTRQQLEKSNWELIKDSQTDCIYIDKNKVLIAIPFVYQMNDLALRRREMCGKMFMYKAALKRIQTDRKINIQIMSEKDDELLKELVKEINHG